MKILNMNSKIKFLPLALMMAGSIDSIRNLPSSALFGASIIFYVIFASLIFLIPTGLVSAFLSSKYHQSEGVYDWVKEALGKKLAFTAIWFQWVNTLIWYPAMLSFIASVLFYLINPNFIHNRLLIAITVIIIFWSLTIINLLGLKSSVKFASICTLFGMIIPMLSIVIMGIIYLIFSNKIAIHFSRSTIFPNIMDFNNITALTAVVTAFLGMELATVHIKKIENPRKNIPKAIYLTVIFIMISMILGSLAIAIVIPKNDISLVGGVIQSFSYFLSQYHLQSLLDLLVLMILIGSLGSTINWIISPAKGLLQSAHDDFLPHFFKHKNKNEVPKNILLLQACIVTLICLIFTLLPSVNGAYWFLSSLSTQLYMVMYLLMFISAIKLIKTNSNNKGSHDFITFSAFVGIIGVTCTIIIGFIPPNNIIIGSKINYEILYISSIIIALIPIILIDKFRKINSYGFI